MVRGSGMVLSASIATNNTLVSLVVALVISAGIGINVTREKKNWAIRFKLKFLLILMVVCVIGSTALCLLVLHLLS
jgi:hypothetical protein